MSNKNNFKKENCEIELKQIKKTYIMGEVKVPVLHGVDLKIFSGEITVVLGASGSGKSTLLNMIGGIDRPSSGDIFFKGENISKFNSRQLTEYRRKNIGFVFQFYNLVPTLTAKENIQVSTELTKDSMNETEALKLVDLGDRAEHFPAQMSGGQQQRVSIARALAKKPRLMLCDEPTGALDSKTGQFVLKTLLNLNEKLKTTILIITHASSIAELAHRIIHLENGKVSRSEENKKRKTTEDISW